MHLPVYLLLPAAAAIVYTIASLLFKRGYAEGATTLATFHWSNLISMPVFFPLFFIRPGPLPLEEWWRPAVLAGLMYAGTWIAFAAIQRGDISVVTPVFGTKVVFVALASIAVSGASLGAPVWWACVLSAIGVFVIGRSDTNPAKSNRVALMLCLVSAMIFGLSDVLLALWAGKYGGTAFLAALPLFLGAYSLMAVAPSGGRTLRLTFGAGRWVILAAILLAVQGMGMGAALAFFNDPAGVNILYSTRGLWAVVLVWWAGAWFANRERERAGRATMLFRFAGTLFITCSVVIAVIARISQGTPEH